MKCFNHSDKDSVGICKACGKGLCRECVTDLGYGLACKGMHEVEVENINTLVSKNIDAIESAPKNAMILPAFFLLSGLVFAGFGYFSKRGITDFSFILGSVFIVFAIVVYFRNRALFNNIAIRRDN